MLTGLGGRWVRLHGAYTGQAVDIVVYSEDNENSLMCFKQGKQLLHFGMCTLSSV